MFSVGGKYYTGDPIVYSYMEDRIFEHSRNISIKLHHRIGKFVKLRFSFASRWIMISEITFDSGNYQDFNPLIKSNNQRALPRFTIQILLLLFSFYSLFLNQPIIQIFSIKFQFQLKNIFANEGTFFSRHRYRPREFHPGITAHDGSPETKGSNLGAGQSFASRGSSREARRFELHGGDHRRSNSGDPAARRGHLLDNHAAQATEELREPAGHEDGDPVEQPSTPVPRIRLRDNGEGSIVDDVQGGGVGRSIRRNQADHASTGSERSPVGGREIGRVSGAILREQAQGTASRRLLRV